MVNRSNPPEIKAVGKVVFPEYQKHIFQNGLEIYDIQSPSEEIVKIEWIFPAGRWHEDKRLTARGTAMNLREGTLSYSAKQIADTLDFYGATFRVDDGFDYASCSMFCLSKYLYEVLPLIHEILTVPTFPEKELEGYVMRSKHRLTVDLEKVDVLAYRTYTELLFGSDHPYGYNSFPENYDALTAADLRNHFEKYYTQAAPKIFIAGKTDDKLVNWLTDNFGKKQYSVSGKQHKILDAPPVVGRRELIRKPESMQTAIRIGRRAVTRNHPDYNGLFVLNMALGGYFGSRLMENLREEKGYTYGIYSTLEPFYHDGYFQIGAEVDGKYTAEAVKEIYKEMEDLVDNPPEEEELTMIKNYIMGNALRSLDGSLNISEMTKELMLYDLTVEDFDNFLNTINNISSEQLSALADRYLKKEDMTEVIAGPV